MFNMPLASILRRSEITWSMFERFNSALVTSTKIEVDRSSSIAITCRVPEPIASNTWEVSIPFSIVSFFQIDCKSSDKLLLPNSVDSINSTLPLPNSQDSTVLPILCCHPCPMKSSSKPCGPYELLNV